MALLLITHDLGIVAHMADRVSVMYAGRIVERASTQEIFRNPLHPYTRGLLACTPPLKRPMPRLTAIPGVLPALGASPNGCRYHPRCDLAQDDPRCFDRAPDLHDFGGNHDAACWKLGS